MTSLERDHGKKENGLYHNNFNSTFFLLFQQEAPSFILKWWLVIVTNNQIVFLIIQLEGVSHTAITSVTSQKLYNNQCLVFENYSY